LKALEVSQGTIVHGCLLIQTQQVAMHRLFISYSGLLASLEKAPRRQWNGDRDDVGAGRGRGLLRRRAPNAATLSNMHSSASHSFYLR
jgi:hypothetical protein